MEAKQIGALVFLGTIWVINVTVSVGLLVAPKGLVAALCQKPTKVANWLRVVGFLILANTLFGVLTAFFMSSFRRALSDVIGMPP
jgi:hypothetical protein